MERKSIDGHKKKFKKPKKIFQFNFKIENSYYSIEYNDGKAGIAITSLPSIYDQAKIDWQYVWDKFPENATSEKRCYKLLRSLRDQKLRMSDWTQFNDSPLTDAKKDEWKTYRQALRDITSSQPTPNIELSNITWPTEPS